ncbi:EpsG family protein [Chryseobacterium geocarposphaerae]|uniref:EpsG-like putative glucosyltransferase n=1 Tax=Chryseobacterium geocarposphaerae TaxID=1416776 RepID=A0A2M9CAG7_9FLAO|nr:EpsG family protein [Chryseobacterium geocarposphaerae]PJJ67825.1 EpsG-like putative glucosyltransferase [Chryseobacterium geocarposphaerae]
MEYFLFLFLFLIFGIIALIDKKKTSKFFFALIAFFFIVLFGGLRYQVGVDWYNYESIFQESTFDNLFQIGIEPFFNLLIVCIKHFNLDYLFFVFFIFTVATCLKFTFLFKYSNSFFAALLIYFPIQFMTYDINGIRQGLAIGITFWSVGYLLEKKLLPFLAIVTLATCCHYSAAIFFPFYFIANIKIKDKYIHIIVFSSVVLGFLLQDMILAYVLPKLSGLESVFAQKVSSYSINENFGKGLSLGFSTFHRLAIFYLFFIFYDKLNIEPRLKNILLNSYLISIVLYFLFSAIEIIASRGSLYYRSFDILIIASFITIPKKFESKMLVLLIIFLYAVLGVNTNLSLPFNGLVPYQNSMFN